MVEFEAAHANGFEGYDIDTFKAKFTKKAEVDELKQMADIMGVEYAKYSADKLERSLKSALSRAFNK